MNAPSTSDPNTSIDTKLSQANKKGIMRKKTMQEGQLKTQKHWVPKDVLRCFFCGGKKCKHENYKKHKSEPAFIGLHSDFITEDIIASQRPSTLLIKKHDIIEQFKRKGVRLIVNVQREGEHPNCGPNELEINSGYSYDPHLFISNDIKCRLSGWKDMKVPDSVNFILDIVKNMAKVIREEKMKVLVHCHAGYGRTGVVIVCYMLYDSCLSVQEVIEKVRSKRKGCVQKKEQYEYCVKFKEYNARMIFIQEKHNLEYFMKNQRDILFGIEAKVIEYIPRLFFKVLNRIIVVKKKLSIENCQIYSLMCQSDEWDADHENKAINVNDWELFENLENITILTQLLYDWLEDNVKYILCPKKLENILNYDQMSEKLDDLIHNPEISKDDENFKKIQEFVEKNLRTIEYETLLFFAKFTNELFPECEEYFTDYFNMIDRVSSLILGYNYEKAYLNENNEEMENIRFQVKGLGDLIRLLGEFIERDENEGLSKLRKTLSLKSKYAESVLDKEHLISKSRRRSQMFIDPLINI